MTRTLCLLALTACSSRSTDIRVTGLARALAADADGVVIAVERDQKSSIEYVPSTGTRVTIKNGAWSIVAIALDADTIYWADLRHLRSAKRGATTFDELERSDDHTISDMAVVGDAIYWTSDLAVWKAPKAAGATRPIEKVWAPQTCRPDELVATSGGLVIACSVSNATGLETQLWKLGDAAPIATSPGAMLAFVSDGTHVLWTTQVDKQLATFELGAAAAIPQPQVKGIVLAVSGTSIVWHDKEATYRSDATATVRIAGDATHAVVADPHVLLDLAVTTKDRGVIRRVSLR